MSIKRIIPLEEVTASVHYNDMAKLAVIFNHDVVETETGIWRWKPNALMRHFDGGTGPFYEGEDYFGDRTKIYRGSISLNDLWVDLFRKKFTVEEMMKFYMQIGYSLGGYGEVWGQKEAYELDLPDAKRPGPDDDPDAKQHYLQTPIDYMIQKYDGQVLKL